MLLKIIGIIIVLVSSSLIGIQLGKQLENRRNDLRCTNLALQVLEKEISFLSNSLPDALIFASNVKSNVSRIFKECGILLKSKQGYCADDAWRISVESNISHTYLNKEDKEILLNLSKSLGYYDIEHQVNSFKMIGSQIAIQEKKAQDIMEKEVKLYKKLAILGGLAIVIVLV